MDSIGRSGSTSDAGETGAKGARSRKRDSLFMSARLTVVPGTTAREVRVRNLSAGGLMAEYERPVATGTPVTLEMRGLGELTGQVAWCTDGRLGIAFDYPIDPARARKPVGARATTPGYAKPITFTAPRRPRPAR